MTEPPVGKTQKNEWIDAAGNRHVSYWFPDGSANSRSALQLFSGMFVTDLLRKHREA
jgi:hypothetical protein